MTDEKDLAHLDHISECAALIRDYTSSGKSEFMSSVLLQDAVLRRLQTMAESTQRLSEGLRAKASEVDWRSLAGFRNILVHDYLGGIEMERVWDAVDNHLPGLEKAVQDLRRSTDTDTKWQLIQNYSTLSSFLLTFLSKTNQSVRKEPLSSVMRMVPLRWSLLMRRAKLWHCVRSLSSSL